MEHIKEMFQTGWVHLFAVRFAKVRDENEVNENN